MLRRKVSLSRPPSTMKVRSKLTSQSQGNGLNVSSGNVPTPKTRFSINDGSSFVPPLKSFPAEQLNKSEVPLSQNPQGNVGISSEMQNSGQGDILRHRNGFQTQSSSQPIALPNQHVVVSEQQVPRISCPVTESVKQSELVIPPAIEVASIERPLHRPNVPSVHARHQTPKNPDSPQLTRSHQTVPRTQMPDSSENEPNQHQHRDPWRVENDSITPSTPTKRSVRTTYPSFYRPNAHLDKNESIHTNDTIAQRSTAGPTGSNIGHPGEEKSVDWSQPHQIYQRHQLNIPNYQYNNVGNDESKRQVAESNSGMKTSQDVMMNHKQSYRRQMQFGPDPQNHGIQNSGAHQQSCTMNTAVPGNVYYQPTAGYQHIKEGRISGGSNSHQILQNNWQTQQMEQNSSQPRPNPVNSLKNLDGGHQLKKEDNISKGLKFSPSMIRDQEMAVTTMRQQGVPEEIMRRQFDALLAEQRKQLLYLQQLEKTSHVSKSNDTQNLYQGRRAQRKISKIQEEGKPEWMLHITPPRIPYSLIENMKTEMPINFQQTVNVLNSVGTPTDLSQQMHNQEPHEHNYSEGNFPNHNHALNVTGHLGQPQMPSHEYPMQQQHYIQVPQESYQTGVNDTGKEIQQTHKFDQTLKTVEPSSLLRLRLDKEVIRQKKQSNGLQDPATVKEAMEALKNPLNRKGFEYLDNLNKRPEKSVSLNGAQDPEELSYLTNGLHSSQFLCQRPKVPSANGLENQRNSSNRLENQKNSSDCLKNQRNSSYRSVSSILQRKNLAESQWPEYPRQKTKSATRDCYNLVAERENGTVASGIPKDGCRSNSGVQQNLMAQNSMSHVPMHMQPRLENTGQVQQAIVPTSERYNVTFPQQNQHHYYANQTEQLQRHPNSYGQSNVNNGQPGTTLQPGSNLQQQYPNRNNEIHEMIVSGGLKYLARKPKYIPNSSNPTDHNGNPGRYHNPSVPCQ